MAGAATSRVRVGVPWRTAAEEAANKRDKYNFYLEAIRAAGGEPVEISLALAPGELAHQLDQLDAIVLPGSPADVDPARYGARRHPRSNNPDQQRERTDYALLDHALAHKKPVLTICYGTQLLNVYFGGSLVQDIPSEFETQIRHAKNGLPPGAADPRHPARIESGTRLAELAGAAEVEVNSSHHQAIRQPGRGLRVVARAPDDVIEAMEPVAGDAWLLGVQWHPERMPGDALAAALFRELVAAARGVAARR